VPVVCEVAEPSPQREILLQPEHQIAPLTLKQALAYFLELDDELLLLYLYMTEGCTSARGKESVLAYRENY
jgi:hypothetical protein